MQDLKISTMKFTQDCLALCTKIPKSREFDNIVRQLMRSSNSVGANYLAGNRAKSDRDFINKLKIVEEEADKSMFWLAILLEINPNNTETIKKLINECDELVAITVAFIKTARKRL